MNDLEKLCFVLDELKIPYAASGPKLGVTNKVTVKQNYSRDTVSYWFRPDGSIKEHQTSS
jgi:hypothetical protein